VRLLVSVNVVPAHRVAVPVGAFNPGALSVRLPVAVPMMAGLEEITLTL